MGLWRLVGLAYVQYWYRAVIARHDEDLGVPAAGAAAAAAAVGRTKARSLDALAQPLVDEDEKRK
jgi:hypothetical protein